MVFEQAGSARAQMRRRLHRAIVRETRPGVCDEIAPRGSAARGIARRLRDHGYVLAAEPQSFFVQGTPGPLEEGELERASQWGRTLANDVMSSAA